MKELADSAIEGFVGSFILAGAIVAGVSGGIWHATARLYDAFVHHKPLPIGRR